MYFIGIDLGGTKIAGGLVDENGRIVAKMSIPTRRERKDTEIVEDMAALAADIIKNSGISVADVKSVGIGAPGTPDNDAGTIVYANNLNFFNTPIRSVMQKYIDLPVLIENDANCAALAESVAGAAKGLKHSVTITLGTGVGTGVVINGKVYSGFNYSAAEMGHMVIISGGEECTCGRKGCWEAYASATALISQTKAAAAENPGSLINSLVNGDLSAVDARTAFDAAKQGDAVGKRVVAQYVKYIAEGLVNVINIFAPEMVIIGGGVSGEGEYLLKPLREMVYRDVYFKGEPKTLIMPAQMGNEAGIVGAAMLGKDE